MKTNKALRVAVVGSREFADSSLMKEILDQESIGCIVSGGAKGADRLAERYAKENGIETKIFLPNWELHGKKAGFIRNREIVENADKVIAFWDGESRGTLNTIETAKLLKKDLKVVYF